MPRKSPLFHSYPIHEVGCLSCNDISRYSHQQNSKGRKHYIEESSRHTQLPAFPIQRLPAFFYCFYESHIGQISNWCLWSRLHQILPELFTNNLIQSRINPKSLWHNLVSNDWSHVTLVLVAWINNIWDTSRITP